MLTVKKQDDGLYVITMDGQHVFTAQTEEAAQQALIAIDGYRRALDQITGR